jgi:hypothetical protein
VHLVGDGHPAGAFEDVDDFVRACFVVLAGERAQALGQRLGLEERPVGPRIHRVLHRRNLTGKHLDVPFVHIWTLEVDKAIPFRRCLDAAGWVGALQG